MRKVLALFALAGLLCVGLTACPSVDNVAACDEWLASLQCGDYDFSGVVDCTVYSETACDISGYFDCLTDATDCDEDLGIVDTTGWADCAEEATCD